LTVSEIYDYGITDPPPLNFEYWYLNYSSPSQTAAGWSFVETSTIGDYGPGDACPAYPDSCSTFEPAFVVSTAPPVPLPASLWLLLSGALALTWHFHGRVQSSTAPR
jgi:hypothetical protein